MSLTTYRRKRSFKFTSEPKGKKESRGKNLIFVVQKHAASRLHYDFRLELNGVLKSWAIPKGPSMNPSDKRLAVMVEDHPYGYKDFEGTIEEGNYGAGEVIVWDKGTYAPVDDDNGSKKSMERILSEQIKNGVLAVNLSGKKLKGEFALVKLKKDDKSWLLFKKRDKFASVVDITKKDKSVLSHKTIESK